MVSLLPTNLRQRRVRAVRVSPRRQVEQSLVVTESRIDRLSARSGTAATVRSLLPRGSSHPEPEWSQTAYRLDRARFYAA